MRVGRIIASIALAILAVIFGISAFTVPAFAATPYLIVTIVCGVLAWFVWPKERNRHANG